MGFCSAMGVVVLGLAVLGASGLLSIGIDRALMAAGPSAYHLLSLSPLATDKTQFSLGYDSVAAGALSGQVAVVTGANTGLGRATAEELARKGATVVCACRSMPKCEAAVAAINTAIAASPQHGRAVAMHADLGSLASVVSFCDAVKKSFQTLDMLVLNAGVTLWAERELTADGVEAMFGVNHLAHQAMYEQLEPLLLDTAGRQKRPVRVVIVSSSSHFDSVEGGVMLTLEDINDEAKWAPMQSYGQSKLANILMGQELARRQPGFIVNMAHPGMALSDTSMNGKRRIKTFFDGVAPKLELGLGDKAVAVFEAVENAITWTTLEGAFTQFYLAAVGGLPSEPSGSYYVPMMRRVPTCVKHAKEGSRKSKKLAHDLWEFSHELIGELLESDK